MPSVNTEGFEYSFASIELKMRNGRKYGATAINYDDAANEAFAAGQAEAGSAAADAFGDEE